MQRSLKKDKDQLIPLKILKSSLVQKLVTYINTAIGTIVVLGFALHILKKSDMKGLNIWCNKICSNCSGAGFTPTYTVIASNTHYMTVKKKICLIIHSLGIGGMERVMALLATNFAEKENVEVHLFLIGRRRKIVYEIPDTVIIHRPGFKFNNSRRIFNTFRTIYFIRSRVKKIHPSTILSFGEMWNNLVLMALYGCKFPVYICDRSQPDKDLGRLHNYLRRTLYPSSTGYIAQTKESEMVCLSKGWNNNVQVIGNPIRPIQTNGQTDKENIVLSVGRLIKTKHFDQLIRMFAEIDNPNWKLVIVGGDAKKLELSKELNTLIEELGAEESVFLKGEQKEIDQYYKKSKIFAFTSSSEGFPNVIGEALSAGLPIISYDCKAGPSDMIQDGKNGFLVPLFNKRGFKNRLKELMNSEKKRNEFKKNAQRSICKYKPAKIADKFYSFIDSYENYH